VNIFDNLETGVQIIDDSVCYRYLNNSLLQQIDMPLDAYIGKAMTEVYPGIENTQLYQKILTCLETSSAQKFKNEFIFEGNRITYWDVKIERITEGVIIFTNDITNTKEGMQLLLESNLRLKDEIDNSSKLLEIAKQKVCEENLKFTKIFDNLPDPCFIVDLDSYQIQDCNPAMEKALGGTRKEILGLSHIDISPAFQKSFNKTSFEASIEIFERLQQKDFVRFEWEHLTLDGDPLYVDVSVSHLIINNKDLFLCVWKDNTLIKKQQQEIVTQTKRAQLNAKLASVGLLAAGVGHEINNPLAIINGYIFNLKRKINNEYNFSDEELLRIFNKVEHASERISKIVSGLKNFSRLENDKESFMPFSPLEVIKESFDFVDAIYRKDQIKLSLNSFIEFDRVLVNGSREKFEQVIMNLLSNAKDAVARNCEKKIEIECAKDNDKIIIAIKDNGTGVSKDLQEKIFDPFFTTKEVGKGTGLGLSLAHEYIQEMNGDLRIESTRGFGASFYISIPLYYSSDFKHLGSFAEIIKV
jgi:PAS domain S-box-containing protein